MTWSPQTSPQVVDARLQGLLKALHLPTVAQHYQGRIPDFTVIEKGRREARMPWI